MNKYDQRINIPVYTLNINIALIYSVVVYMMFDCSHCYIIIHQGSDSVAALTIVVINI